MNYFDNINGIKAKDIELRQGVASLREEVINRTIKPLLITNNGTYTADPTQGTYGYSPITVDVQEEPWEPLEDGYSNFWFELTDDTLSPWLNFSAKNNDAVIDWGDGSGEVALDTLTPTHTYSNAGKYVVKVKGVTEIAALYQNNYDTKYCKILKYVELNNEVSSLNTYAFAYALRLKEVYGAGTVSSSTNAYYFCTALEKVDYTSNSNIRQDEFRYCVSLVEFPVYQSATAFGTSAFLYDACITNVTIPSTVTNIGVQCFQYCRALEEIHVQATTPPTLGASAFANIKSGYVIYVPVGTGETYKATSGWSTYADHILEEGQAPNRLMMAKFNSDNADNEEMR